MPGPSLALRQLASFVYVCEIEYSRIMTADKSTFGCDEVCRWLGCMQHMVGGFRPRANFRFC